MSAEHFVMLALIPVIAFRAASRPLAEGPVTRPPATQPAGQQPANALQTGDFRWNVSKPLIGPASRPADPCHAIKDPSIVYHGGRWHLFCTIRSQKRTHQIEYLSFVDFRDADRADRHVLTCTDAYFCAPQVFFFAPQRRWYLLYQAADQARGKPYGPAFSTTTDIDPVGSWSAPTWLDARKPEAAKAWLDFWVICDDTHAYLFFTSLDGRMWRMATKVADFPYGWGPATVALEGDVFEASHTYTLRGLGQYLTLIEAEDHTARNRRYYKAYLADRLDGEWRPLAAVRDRPFASPLNCRDVAGHWTDSFSHGELLRSGIDQKLEVDPAQLRFVFQGVTDQARQGRPYGLIPWRLGMLEMRP
jgi:hypothetical protein